MKHLLLFALLFSAGMVFAGNFEADCKKVEKWISETYPQRSLSRRMQENNLRRLRKSGDSAALHRQFPKAFGEEWISELKTAKAQGITFSDDNKTLLKCPPNVTSVVIPSCVTTIGDQAFNGCSNLTSVSIPDSVTTIGDGAFFGVESVKLSKNNPVFMIDEFGALLDVENNKLLYLPSNTEGKYTIPDGVTTIGALAFWMCSNLTSISIPGSVTTIENRAFLGCSNLTSVSIPDSVTTIGDLAFLGCSNLTSVSIPSNCNVGSLAFPDNCKVIRK